MIKGITRFDMTWCMSLFGAAVGAGILFLPITIGMDGLYPFLVLAVITGPMTYYSHRGLTYFALSSSKEDRAITNTMEDFFGKRAGTFFTVLYFFSIYPILLVYGVGLTNTVQSFLIHQLEIDPLPRPILSGILVSMLVIVTMIGDNFILKVTEMMVYPLCIILFFLSLSLIPHWNGASLASVPSSVDFLSNILVSIPVLIFAFSHFQVISAFALAYKKRYGEDSVKKTEQVLKFVAIILFVFVMFFVLSCILALSPEDLRRAKDENLSILSYLANHFKYPFISYLGPIIAMLAITSSFFGCYFGAREGLEAIITKTSKDFAKKHGKKRMNIFINIFFLITIWTVAILNPSMITMIKTLTGPVIALILFIMPMYAIYTIPAMHKYKGAYSNIFVTVTGLIAIFSIMYSLFAF